MGQTGRFVWWSVYERIGKAEHGVLALHQEEEHMGSLCPGKKDAQDIRTIALTAPPPPLWSHKTGPVTFALPMFRVESRGTGTILSPNKISGDDMCQANSPARWHSFDTPEVEFSNVTRSNLGGCTV